ncbi:hypothetical protein N7516_010515 [Penicillium verrucosum]|uniref:uncharacterized protein n=1 Tax=Penicillium verrucosum TaxID=60171 RepID=UPI002544EF84|nr:uncharacterized protein N7516_010515 [Penicillium verrucosum]KAJ5922812.1 hypothetical protein N7516_010515 [Penicillium verrucosum]
MATFPQSPNYTDCVRAQHQLISSHLNIPAIDVVVGFSMGGQCSYYWTLMYPELVANAVIICSSARTSRQNYQFLEGPKAALEYAADYRKGDNNTTSSRPLGGLRAFGKAYSAWLTSPEWFENEMYKSLGYETLSHWDEEVAGTNYYNWYPDDLLAMLGMWQRGDVTSILGDASVQEALSRIKARVLVMQRVFWLCSACSDYAARVLAMQRVFWLCSAFLVMQRVFWLCSACSGYAARVLVMPCSTDQYFRWEASEKDSRVIPHSTFKVVPSAWGHLAGLGCNAADKDFMDQAIAEFLGDNG